MQNTFRCPVRWDDLTPLTSGFRHCGHCDRVIADLSWATPEEAAHWMELQGGSACARVWTRPDGRAVFPAVLPVALLAGALTVAGGAVALSVHPEPVARSVAGRAMADKTERARAPDWTAEDLDAMLAMGGYVFRDD